MQYSLSVIHHCIDSAINLHDVIILQQILIYHKQCALGIADLFVHHFRHIGTTWPHRKWPV